MVALQSGVIPAPGYGVSGTAVASSLPPALTPYLLEQDTGAIKGVTGTGQGGDWPQQTVSSAGQGSGWAEAELNVIARDESYSNPSSTQGPWPWSDKFGEAYGVVPDDGINTYRYPISNKKSSGFGEFEQQHPGSNLVSQSTDTAGWQQNTPSGRTAVRRLIKQDYLGVQPFWFPSAPMPSPVKSILVGQPVNGQIAEYGGIYGAGGNTALEIPAPPAISTASPVTSTADSGLNQYGSF